MYCQAAIQEILVIGSYFHGTNTLQIDIGQKLLLHFYLHLRVVASCIALVIFAVYVVFTQSDAAATIYFITQICGASIGVQLLFKSGVY